MTDLAGLAGTVWLKLPMIAVRVPAAAGRYLVFLLKAKLKAKRPRLQIRLWLAGLILHAECSSVRIAELLN